MAMVGWSISQSLNSAWALTVRNLILGCPLQLLQSLSVYRSGPVPAKGRVLYFLAESARFFAAVGVFKLDIGW